MSQEKTHTPTILTPLPHASSLRSFPGPSVPWGGLLETLELCEDKSEIPETLKILKEKLTCLEASKNIEEIKASFVFTTEEINYLNSPLLDEINKSIINKAPLFYACQNNLPKAVKFYLDRVENSSKITPPYLYSAKTMEILDLLLEKNPELKQYYSDVIDYAIELGNFEVVKTLHTEKNYRYMAVAAERYNYIEYLPLIPDSVIQNNTPHINLNVVKYLLEKGYKVDENMENYLRQEQLDIAKFFIDRKMSSVSEETLHTFLVKAIKDKNLHHIKYILNLGAKFKKDHDYVCNILFTKITEKTKEVLNFLLSLEIFPRKTQQLYNSIFLRTNIGKCKFLYELGYQLDKKQTNELLTNIEYFSEEILNIILKYQKIEHINWKTVSFYDRNNLKIVINSQVAL